MESVREVVVGYINKLVYITIYIDYWVAVSICKMYWRRRGGGGKNEGRRRKKGLVKRGHVTKGGGEQCCMDVSGFSDHEGYLKKSHKRNTWKNLCPYPYLCPWHCHCLSPKENGIVLISASPSLLLTLSSLCFSTTRSNPDIAHFILWKFRT